MLNTADQNMLKHQLGGTMDNLWKKIEASKKKTPRLEPRALKGSGHCKMTSLFTMGKKGTGTCFAKMEGEQVESEISCAGEHPVS